MTLAATSDATSAGRISNPGTHDVRLAAMRKVSSFADDEVPALLKKPALVTPFIFAGIAALATAGLMLSQIGSAILGALIVSALVAFTMGYLRFWNNHKARESTSIRVTGAVEQLEAVLQFIEEYTRFVDRRTSAYFHCVTNTKISSYFALTEIRDNLTRRIGKIRDLATDGSRSALIDAFISLQGTLVINSKVMSQGGTMRIIPIARVNLVVRQLVESIEEGLDVLESEIEIGSEHEDLAN